MRWVVLLACVVLLTPESDSRVWTPLGSPFVTIYPCKGTVDIALLLEPGLPLMDNNRYYIYISKSIPAHSVTKVTFDAEVNILVTVKSNDDKFSRIPVSDGETFTLQFAEKLDGLSFIVKGTRPGVTPYLIGLSIDDVEYCVNRNLKSFKKYAETENPPQDGEYQWSIKNAGLRCGRRKVDHQELAVDGASQPGDWPWHAALFKFEDPARNSKLKYMCGGTLISKRVVVTVAHCLTRPATNVLLRAQDIRVALGKYNLAGNEEECREKEIASIIVHKDYRYQNLYSDLALLMLKSAVQFTARVRPACLWHRSDAAGRPTDDSIIGTLAGWGYSDSDALSQTLQQVNLPMVAATTCVRTNHAFAHLLNKNEFCAGYHNNETSPCRGDSGGGFMVFIPDKKQDERGKVSGAWYMRGVLSRGLGSEDLSCQDDYVIFTDLAAHGDWLDSHLDNHDTY